METLHQLIVQVQEAKNTLQDILSLPYSQEENVGEILIEYGLDDDVYVEEGDDIVASKRLTNTSRSTSTYPDNKIY